LKTEILEEEADAKNALHLISNLVGHGGRFPDELGMSWESFLNLVESSSQGEELKSLAKIYKIQNKIDRGQFHAAIALARNALRSTPNDELWLYCNSQIVYGF